MALLRLLRNVLATLIVLVAGLLAWGYNRTLPQPTYVESFAHETLVPFNKRHMEHITLHTAALGDIGIAISMPDPLPPGKLPVVMVLGGLDTGEHNIHNIVDAGNNVIVGYDWSMPVDPPNNPAFLMHVPQFYHRAMIAPAQIATAIGWLAKQPWADDKRISLLGYSMGALAAPAAQELSQESGHSIGWTIIAYGGAPLVRILLADRHIKPEWMRYALAPFVSVMFHPLEPDLHLQNLLGHFLILEGKNDELMPESARIQLHDAVPEPKTIIVFDGDHMGVGPGKAELMDKIIATSREWLTRTQAVNPL